MKLKFLWVIIIQIFLVNIFAIKEVETKIIKPDTLYIGQPFKLNVILQSAKGDSISTTRKDTLDFFQIISVKQLDKKEENGKLEIAVKAVAFDTGIFEFPSLYFNVKNKDGITEYKSKTFPVRVASVLKDSTNQITDISPMININLSLWEIISLILGLLMFIALIYLLYRKFKGKKNISQNKQIIVDNRSASQKAFEKLYKLKEKNLVNKGDFLNYYFELVYILRFFLEEQFKFNAVELTTSEIKQKMIMVSGKERTEILSFLGKSDQIKFAKGKATINQAEEDYNWLEKYLKDNENKFTNNENGEKNA